jgi:arabinofuranosyltransferase
MAFTALTAVLVVHARQFFDFQVDDAFIVLRYADNLRHGFGLTFNPGERVEGFTCPLLVIIEAAFMRLNLNAFVTAKVLGLLCGVATLGMTLRMALTLTRSIPVAVFAGAVLVMQSPFALACVNGLETAPFAACITASLSLSLAAESRRQEIAASVLLAVAFFFRPEAALALVLITTDALVRQHSWAERRRTLSALLLPFGLIALPFYAWKAVYFSSLTPNTALAKLPAQSAGRLASGWAYLAEYSGTHWEVVAYVSLALLAIRGASRFRTLAWFAFVWLGWIVFSGGDWIVRGRFLIPLLPIIAVSLGGGVSAAWRWLARSTQTPALLKHVWAGLALAALLVLGNSWLDWGLTRYLAETTTIPTQDGKVPLGRWLGTAIDPGATVAAIDVGALAYYSAQRVIDTGGLTDSTIARMIHGSQGRYMGHLFFPDESGAKEIALNTLARRPEVVVALLYGEMPKLLTTFREARARGENAVVAGFHPQDQALVNAPELSRDYRWICSNLEWIADDGTEARYNVFIRKDVKLRTEPTKDDEGHTVCL